MEDEKNYVNKFETSSPFNLPIPCEKKTFRHDDDFVKPITKWTTTMTCMYT